MNKYFHPVRGKKQSFSKHNLGPALLHPFRPRVELLEIRLAPANVDVLSFHNDLLLSGQNLQEEILTPANVSATNFGKLFSKSVDGYVYAQPLYKATLTIPGQGVHNVAFIATEHDSVYAFDADSPEAGTGPEGSLWKTSFLDPANGITSVPARDVGIVSTNIVPEVGITGTPVIDGVTGTLYLVAKTKEIRDGVAHYVQKLHALGIADGREKFGGPALIGDTTGANTNTSPISVPGNGDGAVNGTVTFNARKELNRPALQLVNGVVYIAWASHEDDRPYHGWVVGFNTLDLAAGPVRWFNTAPNAGGVGIWQSGGGLSADLQGNLYFAVGNGFNGPNFAFDPAHGNYSESVLKLSASGPLTVADSFTPFDWQTLDNQDADLGSGGSMLLPDYVGTAAHQHLVLETGKTGLLYLIDRDGMGGFTMGGPDHVVQRVAAGQGGVWGNPSFFKVDATTGIIYYHGQGDFLKGYYISNGHIEDGSRPGDRPILHSNVRSGYPGMQPVVSANGIANPTSPINGIVWELQVDAYGAEGHANGSSILRAIRTTDFSTELYNSSQTSLRDLPGGAVKFTVPVVTNGHVLVGAQYSFSVFGLFPPATSVPLPRTNLQGAVQASSQGPQIQLTWMNPAPPPGAAATGIKILRSLDGATFNPVAEVAAGIATYTDPGPFTIGQHYFYRVVAVNQVGESAPSNTVDVVAPIPSAVLTIPSITSSALGLSWTSVANDHYDIERSRDGINFTRLVSLPATQTTYTDSGLMPGVYGYRVHAFNLSPTADSLSNVSAATVGGVIDHSMGFGTSIDLTGNGDTQFAANVARLTRADLQTGSFFAGTRLTIAQFTTSFLVRLSEGTQPNYADGFTFVIQANDPTALGQGLGGLGYQGINNSVAVKFGTFQYPGDPSNSSTGLVVNGAAPRGGVTTGSVLLNSQNPKQVDLNYNGTTLTETVTDTLTGASFSTTFTVNIPLVIGSDQAYLGFTASTGSPGASSFWELQDIGTWQFSSRAPLPGSPSNLRVSATSDSEIDLAWNGNSFNETGFRIERSVDGGATFTEVGTSSSTSFADRNLARGSYYYRVLAYNAAGNSSFTNVVGATVPPNDPPPVITGITRSNFTVKPNGTLTLTVAFTDPDPNDQHTAIINWGDNSSPTTMPLAGGVVQFTASHSYLNAPSGANFPIRIAVQDDDGGNDTVTLAVSAASVTPPPGLADWYTGDGFTPSAAADIAGNNPGTLVGGVTYLPGEVGNAFNFNGTDAYVRLPNNFIPFPSSGTSNAPLSFTAWFETTAGGVILGQQGGPALAGAPAGWVPAVYVGTDGKLRVQLFWNGGVNSVTSPAPVNDGRFHFVAVSSDGFTESVYLDNQFLGTTSGLQASYTNNYFYQLGTGYTAGDWQAVTGGWYSFRGLVDEVQFYNAAISASAIQGIYNAGSAGQVKGVMAVDLPPVLAGLSRSAFSLNENGTFTLQGTFSDPQPGDPHTAVINWGDGSPETTVPVGASTFTFSAPHRYVDEPSSGPGYPIRVTLRDIAGGSDSVLLTANALAITPPSGLVGWWTGDGTNPAIAPDIAGNHPGFLGSGVTYSPGRVDNAFSFDGSTSASVNIANAADLNITSGATWDFWVNTTQANVFTGLVGKHDPTTSLNGVTSFIWPTGVAAVQIKNASQVLTLIGNSRVNDGLFHHIALTFQSGATARLYVDGRQQDSGTAPAFSFNPNPLRFGRLSDPFWQTLRGSLDEVQVFNRILSADEIQGIVNAGGAGQVKAVTVLDPAVVATGGFTINTVAGMGTGPVTVAAFSDPPGAEGLSHYSALINWGDNSTPSRGTITGPNSNGVFTVLGDHDYTTAGRLPITVTISHDRSPDATANSTAVVAPAPADHFGIQAPAARPASSPFIILVTALDRFANVATGYRGTITFSGSDPQALFEPNYPFTADDNGTHSFAVVLFTAGNQSITVTDTQDPSIFGTQANIRVTPLAPASLRVAGFPIPAASGASLPFVVSALDRYGNVATDYQGTISLGSSDPRAVFDFPSYQFTAEDNGSHTFHGLLRTLGNQSISTVDSDNQFFAMQSDITVIPARLEVSGFPSPTRAGAAGTFTVRVVDFDGNVLPDYHGTVSFISSDPIAVLPRDYAFTTGPGGDNGIHVFGAILKTAGTQAITATDTLFTTVGGTQENIIVSPSPVAGSFRVFNIPSPIVAGTSATVMVTVYDPYGNISTPYRGTIHFRTDPNDPMADLPEDYTFVASDNGTATFPAGVTLRKAGTVSVIVADTVNGATGSQDVVVTPANAVGFLVYGFVSPTQAGALHPFRVNPVDAFGNTGAPYSGTVTFASTDPAANLPNDTPFVAGDDGSMEFFAALNTVGTQSIFATDTVDGSITGSQDNIDVVSGAGAPGPGGGRGRLPWQAVTASDLSANDAANHRRLSVLSWQAADKRQLRTNYGMTQGNLNLGSQPPQIRPAHRYRTDILDLFFGEWSNGVNLGSVLDSSQKWIAPPLVSEG